MIAPTRKLQLLIYKLFSNLEFLDLSLGTQDYIFQSLEMLNEVLNNHEIIKNSEIQYMFYTEALHSGHFRFDFEEI